MKMTSIISSKIEELFGCKKDNSQMSGESDIRQEYEKNVGIIGAIVDYFACLRLEKECEKHQFDASGAGCWGYDETKPDILKTKEDCEAAGIGLRYEEK